MAVVRIAGIGGGAAKDVERPTGGAQRVMRRPLVPQSPPQPEIGLEAGQEPPMAVDREPTLREAGVGRGRAEFIVQVNGVTHLLDADEVTETPDGSAMLFKKDGADFAMVKKEGQPEYLQWPRE